jgi:hypothetical protein
VQFKRSDVTALIWKENRQTPPPPSMRREYWERCLVDRCVVEENMPVHFLYREEPDMAQPGHTFPDSGWRIRGDYRNLDQPEIDARALDYIALGVVLNHDDSWLHLIDEPTGAAFIRDWESGDFVADAG